MQEKEILELVEKYLSGTASPEEESKLLEWYRSYHQKEIEVQLDSEKEYDVIRQRLAKNLNAHTRSKKAAGAISTKMIYRLTAAAVILLVVAGLWFIISKKSTVDSPQPTVAKTNDVPAPKSTKAMITLADGRTVALDSVVNGTLVVQDNVQVIKTADNKITYRSTAQPLNSSTLYNTLTNPRGSKVIDMQLSDGSHVWLNAGSSVKYPVAFIGTERKVEITGEAYFEVAHDAAKPFHVIKGETDITVLGTHFNVNAYDDEEALKVTLLEGSVKVSHLASHVSRVIKPGEQVALNAALTTIVRPDLDDVMAWKNGVFQMNNTDIATIMRQLSRWYDVDIVYEKGIPDGHITGKVPRDINLSNVLKVLEYSGMKFSIEEKKIIVKS